jgi:hypothetical protein
MAAQRGIAEGALASAPGGLPAVLVLPCESAAVTAAGTLSSSSRANLCSVDDELRTGPSAMAKSGGQIGGQNQAGERLPALAAACVS